jgi:hypothetical protein
VQDGWYWASLAPLVLIFVGAIPKFASYSEAWVHMTNLGAWSWMVIALAAMVTQISAAWHYQSALPGLRFRHGFLEIETTSAVSSTVPAGGAVQRRSSFAQIVGDGTSPLPAESRCHEFELTAWSFRPYRLTGRLGPQSERDHYR